MSATPVISDAFQRQISACQQLGSPFTASVLQSCLEIFETDGILNDLLAPWTGTSQVEPPADPWADALPLRVAGALHGLVLSGRSSTLVDCYPTMQSAGRPEALRAAITEAIHRHRPYIEQYLTRPPQTNETLRSAALLGGFMTVSRATGLPLRLLELGASAGLNMIWDRYRYRLGTVDFGPATSPVLLETEWQGPLPDLHIPAIHSRAACDRAPVDIGDPDQQLRLRSYVWADQQARLSRLEAAIALALAAGIRVEQGDAADWLERQLAESVSGAVAVIYHSVIWQYLGKVTQQRLLKLMEQAGEKSPLAWLRFEPSSNISVFELRLTLWRDGLSVEKVLANAHPHGATVQWRDATAI